MPTYEFTDKFGRTLEVEGTQLPSIADVDAMFAEAYPPPASEGGLLETVKQGGKGLLELLGRPGEFVSGFAGGALQGGIGEGLRRGAAAAFEPNLADSQIQESFNKVLQEQNILTDSPKTRAAAGFLGDVLFDPLNLLGGMGVIRRGAVKGASLLGAGAKAEQLLTAPNRAFARAMAPIAESTRKRLATLPGLRKLQEYPNLIGLPAGKSGITPEEYAQLYASQKREGPAAAGEAVQQLIKKLTPEERKLYQEEAAFALGKLDPTIQAKFAANPLLQEALTQSEELLKQTRQRDVGVGVLNERFSVKPGTKLQKALNALSQDDLDELSDYLKFGNVAGGTVPALSADLQKIADGLVARLSAKDKTLLYDPAELQFAKDAKSGAVTVTAKNEALNYLPLMKTGDVEQPTATMVRAVSPTLQQAKTKTLSAQEFFKLPEAERNLETLIRRRLIASSNAQTSAEYLKTLTDQFGSTVPKAGFAPLSETLQKDLQRLDALRPLVGYYYPKEIADELNKTLIRMQDPEAVEGVIRRGLTLFKGMATSMNIPAYPSTNFVGNTMQMHLAGMRPDQIIRELTRSFLAMRKHKAILADTSGSRRAFKIPGLTDREVLEQARRYGIIGTTSGFSSEFAAPDKLTPMAQLLTTGRLNPLNPQMAVYSKVRDMGQTYIEDPSRLALFLHELRRGESVERAVLTTKKHMIDYAALTPLERKTAGLAVPFYTWTRKSTPLWLAALALKPGKVSQQQNLFQLFQEAFPDEDLRNYGLTDDKLPTYMQRPDQIPLPAGGGTPLRGRLKLPYFDILRPFEAVGAPVETVSDLLSPAIKVPLELALGERLRGGKIFEGYGAPTPVGEVLGLAGQVPGTDQRLQSNLSRYLTGQIPVPAALRPLMTEPRVGSEVPQWQRAVYAALGLSPQEVTPEMLQWRKNQKQQEKASRKRARRDELLGGRLQ